MTHAEHFGDLLGCFALFVQSDCLLAPFELGFGCKFSSVFFFQWGEMGVNVEILIFNCRIYNRICRAGREKCRLIPIQKNNLTSLSRLVSLLF